MAVNWPGLLAWSTKYHDGTKPSEFKMMTPEDREFLETAMKEAFKHIENPNEVFAESIGQINASDRSDESIATALEVIDRLCDDVDVARNAEKLNGIQPLLDLLGSHRGALRVRTLEILALLFSNNPAMQAVGEKRGALDIFLRILKEPESDDEQSKVFRALVALVRSVQPMEERLLKDEDGVSMLIGFLAVGKDGGLQAKTASFVRSLAADGRLNPEDAGRIAEAVAPLIAAAGGQGLQYRETFAACATELATRLQVCEGEAESTSKPVLRTAAKKRFAELLAAANPDDENEMEGYKECMTVLDTPASPPVPPPAPAALAAIAAAPA